LTANIRLPRAAALNDNAPLFMHSRMYGAHAMKEKGHPKYNEIDVTCSCGNKFKTRSTMTKELHIEVCSVCHPFYTGKQKIVDTAGRVERFKQKYARGGAKSATA
jgi:large subunit ribosomal protein L31